MKSQLSYERRAHGEAAVTEEDEAVVASIKEADARFLEEHPAADFLRALEARRGPKRRSRLIGVVTAAMAAGLALAILIPLSLQGGEETRMKGRDLNLFVYHKVEGGTEILGRDTALGEGDSIQIAYFAKGPAWAAILSLDGRGTITRHLPLHGSEALAIDTKEFALLPYAYTLDDAPVFEDLYFIVSPRPFKVEAVEPFLRAAYDNGTSEALLPAPWTYKTIRIKKTEAQK